MNCPSIKPAFLWLCDLWEKLTDQRIPWDARALLLDDQRYWKPAGPKGTQRLWQRLRAATLHSIWVVRCKRSEFESRVDGDISAAAITLTQVSIRGDIRREWAQTRLIDTLAEGGFGHINTSGQQLELPMETFEEHWTLRDVLCSVTLDPATGKHSLHVKNPVTWA
jgi:hypothetical protein